MSSRTGNWLIALGAVMALLGLICLPSALGESGDRSLLSLGSAAFSLGALVIAAGIYLKASALQPKSRGKSGADEKLASPLRGGCDSCKTAAPVIHCKVHQVHLCGSCLEEHYDFRSCVYAPSTRRASAVKAMAARAR